MVFVVLEVVVVVVVEEEGEDEGDLLVSWTALPRGYLDLPFRDISRSNKS